MQNVFKQLTQYWPVWLTRLFMFEVSAETKRNITTNIIYLLKMSQDFKNISYL